MPAIKAQKLFQHVDDIELRFCIGLNRYSEIKIVQSLFWIISRLGNGVFWYSLMIALPLYYGEQGLTISGQMLLSAAIGLVIYKLLKERLVRERPCFNSTEIQLGAAPLDKYSFPSGHTLHAVSFTIVVLTYLPHFWPLLIPFAILTALSRVVLGLHYPTDVLAGALIGVAVSQMAIAIIG